MQLLMVDARGEHPVPVHVAVVFVIHLCQDHLGLVERDGAVHAAQRLEELEL